MSKARVLLLGPQPFGADALLPVLEASGLDVERVGEVAVALERADADELEVIVAELSAGGRELLEALGEGGPPLILTDAFGSIEDAVDAMRRGAAGYLAMPAPPEQVQLAVERALEQRRLEDENRRLRDEVRGQRSLGGLLSRDPAVLRMLDTVEAVADTKVSVLITGESGTGKTLLAHALHQSSSRAGGPFVEVNCGALPKDLLESELFGHKRGAFTGALEDSAGKFEAADGGTLFLDEIGTAPHELQVKLLRVLEDQRVTRLGESAPRTVDVRLLAATNADLAAEVRAGRFREDLYYRLDVLGLRLPPLRERPLDVPLLAERFLERFNTLHGRAVEGFEPEALRALCEHAWPGNVRELRHALERAVLLCAGPLLDTASLGLTPPTSTLATEAPAVPGPLREELARAEREALRRALLHCEGSRVRAAELLGINRATLFAKIRKYKLGVPPRPRGGTASEQNPA